MKETATLNEIKDMIKLLVDEHDRLQQSVNELKEEQKKLQAEVRYNNFVLSNINFKSEIVN